MKKYDETNRIAAAALAVSGPMTPNSPTPEYVTVPRAEIERTITLLRYVAHPGPSPHADALSIYLAAAPTPPSAPSGEALAVAREREACAKLVDHILKAGGGTYGDLIRRRAASAEGEKS